MTRTATTATYHVEDPGPFAQDDSGVLSPDRQRKDTRIFAHAAAETQVAIKDALTLKNRTVESFTYSANEPGFLEVFPRVASRPPKLLQELEAIIVDRLRVNDKAASLTAIGSAKDRDPKLSANLSLDAHRQVFSAFIHGFSTYSPLLARIQAEFDRALNDGVRCAQENVEMRTLMARNEMQRERAAANVRGQVLAEDLTFRASSLQSLQDLNERVTRAEKKKMLAEKDLKEAQNEEARMRAVVAELRKSNRKLLELVDAEDQWAAKPLSQHIATMAVGPLTKEDEDFLEQEIGGVSSTLAAGSLAPALSGAVSMVFRATSTAVPPTEAAAAAPAAVPPAGPPSGDAGAPPR